MKKYKNYHKAEHLLSLLILNKHSLQMLGQFFEFNQNVVNLGILLQDFSFFCSDGSNPNDGGLFHTVLVIVTHPLLISMLLLHILYYRNLAPGP